MSPDDDDYDDDWEDNSLATDLAIGQQYCQALASLIKFLQLFGNIFFRSVSNHLTKDPAEEMNQGFCCIFALSVLIPLQRWYYDDQLGRCRNFTYGQYALPAEVLLHCHFEIF